MIDRLSPFARNVALAVVFVLLAWFCWSVRSVLNPLILGYLLAFVLHPLVLRLERQGWSRRAAVNLIFSLFAVAMMLLGLVVFVQGRGLVREITAEQGLGARVSLRIDEAFEKYKDEINWAVRLFHKEPPVTDGVVPPDDPELRSADDFRRFIAEAWRDWLKEGNAVETGTQAAGIAATFVKKIFGNILAFLGLLVLLPIYTWFLLFELERIHGFVQRYLPRGERDRMVKIGTQIGEVLANFFRGRLLVCLCKGSVLSIGLWIAGVDYAVFLGLGTGFLTLIPFVGGLIGFVMATLIALLEYELGDALLRTGIVFAFAEALENYFLIPKILGDSLGLHPVVVIFALLAGGASLGMLGLLIALPLAASLVILGREYLLPVMADLADRDERRERPREGGDDPGREKPRK